MDKFASQTLADFTAQAASADGGLRCGGVAALAGALAAALGSAASAADAGSEDAVTLGRIWEYMLHLIDEDGKAHKPLEKYLSLPEDDPERAGHMDSALRVACYIPTEVMYTAGDAAEILSRLAGSSSGDMAADVGTGLLLCRAAMRASELNILQNAAHMADDVFAMTLRRECELVFEKYDPVIDAALTKVKGRF